MITAEDLSRLGTALKDLRWASRKTQAQISAKTGMNAPQLSRYENGHEVPTLESLVKYLSALGCDLCDLQRALAGDVTIESGGEVYTSSRGKSFILKVPRRRIRIEGGAKKKARKPAGRPEQKLELTKEDRLTVIEERLREMEEIVAEMREE